MPGDPLTPFHPIVGRWFAETLGEPCAPRRAGWPAIAHGEDTLILAPTGTGKTLPAEVRDAARALAERLVARQQRGWVRDLVVETIDGERAAASRWGEALREAGFRGMGTGLRYYAVPDT